MSCTPTPDSATKKTRVSQCCSSDPPDQYLNNPVVTVPNTSGGTSDIPAAMQPWEYCGYGPTGGCGRPNNWHDFCGQLYDGTNADVAIPCGTGGGPSVEGRNVFTLNPDYVYKKRCQLPGWKGVVAMPLFQGRNGFMFTPNCCPTGNVDYKYTSQKSEFSCSISGEGGDKFYDSGGATTREESFSGSTFFSDKFDSSVDAYGNRNATAVGHSATNFSHSSETFTPIDAAIVNVNLIDECGHDAFSSGYFNQAYFAGGSSDYIPGIDFIEHVELLFKIPTITNDCGTFTVNWGSLITQISGNADQINAANRFGLGGGVTMGEYTEPDGSGGTITWNRKATDLVPLSVINYSDDEIYLQASGAASITETKKDSGGNLYYEGHRTLTWDLKYRVQLSGKVTFQSVQDDGKELLATWNLGNHEQYPWRQDGKVWLLPLVTRDAIAGSPDGFIPPCADAWSPTDSGYVETPPGSGILIDTVSGTRAAVPRVFSESRYTGRIIGAPQEVGKARYFNFDQKVVCAVCSSGLIIQDNNWFCTSGWGQLSYDPLPKTATQWTDAEMGSLLTEGGYCIQYGPNAVLMCKWAENLKDWPSVNFARPAGRDRFLIDFAAAGLTDDPACSGTAGIAVGTFTSDIVTDASSFLYAHRKFPTCRPIGSTIGITSAVDNGDGTVTLTTAEKHWLCGDGDGHGYTDKIDFYGVAGLGAGVIVQTATPGSTTFIVNGSLTGAYSSGGYIASEGMTAELAQWDWTCSRHQFCVQEWDVNPRAYGGWNGTDFTTPVYKYTETQAQLPPKSGWSALVISPNNDVFPDNEAVYRANWKDIQYEVCGQFYFSAAMGNKWHCKFLQCVQDPFFIAPVKCSGDASPDNFTTSPFCWDTTATLHYALVEPMTQLPPDCPPPQVDIPLSHDGGVPNKVAVNCSFPADRFPTFAVFNATYIACTEPGWREATHNLCPANNFPLPNASGYIAPVNGNTPPELRGNVAGAGGNQGGAGAPAPGAGDDGGFTI